MLNDSSHFDLDVDVAPLLGVKSGPLLVDGLMYELLGGVKYMQPELERAVVRAHHSAMLEAQWKALSRRWNDERRRAMRAPILSRVRLDNGAHMVACDVSQDGLRCSGVPTQGVFDVEFKIPGLAFPVDARAEVVDYKAANVLPLVNLRFVNLDRPYKEHLERYVQSRVRRAA